MLRHSTDYGRNDVKRLFSSISSNYDLANHWMTWGQDVKWRRELLVKANLPPGGMLLDVGVGTGDLSIEALSRDKSILVVGVDFTPEMMQLGRQREGGEYVRWVNSDALNLPCPSGLYDAVVSGFVLRNVLVVERALAEQYRVLRAGGRVVCLDTTPPADDAWHLPVRLYLHYVIPFIGGLAAGDGDAYKYLARSTEAFMKVEELATCFQNVGFKDVQYQRFMGGVVAIHWGSK